MNKFLLKATLLSFFLMADACGEDSTSTSTTGDGGTTTETSTSTSSSSAEEETETSTTTSTSTAESTATSSSTTNTENSGSRTTDTVSVSYKIAAFNADILGKTKMSKANIVGYIADIITRYDIILIQEVRDSTLETHGDLLARTNLKDKGTYNLSASSRLGRTSSKEQYVFYYKTDFGLRIEKAEVYADPADVFEREPYIIKFSDDSIFSFVLIGIHVKPGDAIAELNNLGDVYRSVTSSFPSDDWIILGDLNADCSYVSNSAFRNLDLSTAGFTWEISKDADTTVTSTNCAYDNIVSKSQNISNAGIFDFKTQFNIDSTTAEAISNHFPVEFDLKLP